jgi:cellulose biosynthesis protein BcsQ
MSIPIVTFFNNKGGVGKTSTLYNLSTMFAKRGKRVLAVDLDPQANLTSLALDDDLLEQLWDVSVSAPARLTIYHAIRPIMEGLGDVQTIQPQSIPDILNFMLLPGDLRLSQFEDTLAIQWNSVLGGKAIGLNVTSAFARLIHLVAERSEADVVFVDVGPNLGAINRAALIASHYVVIPLVPDLFSLQGLTNVGKFLAEWRQDWKNGLERSTGDGNSGEYPSAQMQPIGYIILQHRERQSRLVASHQRWADQIPKTYARDVLKHENGAYPSDPNQIGQVRNYQSLMALSHEARKPIWDLKPADGAIGSHNRVVQEAYSTYHELAGVIAEKIGLTFDD